MPEQPLEVLYCGDTALDNAASYLCGVLASGGHKVHYVPSDTPLEPHTRDQPWQAIIFSDYPEARISKQDEEVIRKRIHDGAGLLMIGGWESFHGTGGDWDKSGLADLLPVEISKEDDRLNCDRPLVVRQCASHAITDGLPWDSRPPLIGGLNKVIARPMARILLAAEQWDMRWVDDGLSLSRASSYVLLAVGQTGKGRTAAFASDVAPHWIGPMVDWGLPRLAAAAPGAPAIEVGTYYAEFFTRLVAWTAGRLD